MSVISFVFHAGSIAAFVLFCLISPNHSGVKTHSGSRVDAYVTLDWLQRPVRNGRKLRISSVRVVLSLTVMEIEIYPLPCALNSMNIHNNHVCSGSIIPWFKSEFVSIFYGARSTAQDLPKPLSLYYWVPVMSNIKTATGCESNRQLQLLVNDPNGNHLVACYMLYVIHKYCLEKKLWTAQRRLCITSNSTAFNDGPDEHILKSVDKLRGIKLYSTYMCQIYSGAWLSSSECPKMWFRHMHIIQRRFYRLYHDEVIRILIINDEPQAFEFVLYTDKV